MANKNRVSIIFDADGKAVIKTSDGIETKITGNNKKIVKDTKSATKKISGLWRTIGIAAAAGVAGLAIKRLSASILEAASISEQYEVRLQHLLGSQAEGSRLFDEMAIFAGKVPFEYEKIMGAATQLSGVMKGGVDEVKEWIPLIGDLAAVSGLSIEQTTEQVVRMYSAGAGAADLFRERGITSMLGFQAGVAVSAEDTRKKLMEEWNKQGSQFKGATADLAKTWTGMTSMLSDAWFAFRTKIAEAGVFNFVKAGITLIIEKIEELKKSGDLDKWAKNISDSTLKIIKTFALGAAGIADTLSPVMRGMWGEIKFMWDQFKGLPTWVQGVGIVGAFMGGPKGAIVVGGLLHLTGALKNSMAGLKAAGQGHIAWGELARMNAEELAKKLDEIAIKKKIISLSNGGEAGDLLAMPDLDSYEGKVLSIMKKIEDISNKLREAEKQPAVELVPPPKEGEGADGEDPIAASIKRRMQFRDEEIEQLANIIDIQAFHAERGVAISDAMTGSILANNKMMVMSKQAMASLSGKANQAMENQMLSLIETGKFSVGAMAQIMAQQVKIELAGLAARAAVQAIYFTAMGIAGSTPWGAAIVGPGAAWFAAAGQMALVAGAALAGAAVVNAVAGGAAERPEPGTPGGIPIQVDSGGGREEARDEKTPLQIIINQNAGVIGTAEAAKFYEDTLLPIINEGGDRDVKISFNALATET